MSEDKIEIIEAGSLTSVNECNARQAGDFLDSYGKSEMAKTMKFLLDHYESTCANKNKVKNLGNKHAYKSSTIFDCIGPFSSRKLEFFCNGKQRKDSRRTHYAAKQILAFEDFSHFCLDDY